MAIENPSFVNSRTVQNAPWSESAFRNTRRNRQQRAQITGLDSLLQILQSQGATDPRLMNQQIAQIQRGTEAQQMGLQETLAGQGYNSGVGAALQAAIGQGGQERISNRMAEEAALQEQRKRQDIALLYQTLIASLLTKRGQNIQKLLAQMGGGGGGWESMIGPVVGAAGQVGASYFGSKG